MKQGRLERLCYWLCNRIGNERISSALFKMAGWLEERRPYDQGPPKPGTLEAWGRELQRDEFIRIMNKPQ